MSPAAQTTVRSSTEQQSGLTFGQHDEPVKTVPGGQQRAFLPLPNPRSGEQHVPLAHTLSPSQHVVPQQSTCLQHLPLPPQFTSPFGQHFPFEQCSPAFVLQQPTAQHASSFLQQWFLPQHCSAFVQHSRPQVVLAFGQAHLPVDRSHFLSGGQHLPAQHPSPSRQHAWRWSFAQHFVVGASQHVPGPLPPAPPGVARVTQSPTPFLQHLLSFFDAQYSSSVQHALPHFSSNPKQPQFAATGPGPQRPPSMGCEAFGLHGSQHEATGQGWMTPVVRSV
jgi:hypothetical protein